MIRIERQVCEFEFALIIGDGAANVARNRISDIDAGTCNRGSGGIQYGTANSPRSAAAGLRKTKNAGKEQAEATNSEKFH